MKRDTITVKERLKKYNVPELFTKKSVHSEECIVGYLDILGSTERILSDDENESSLNAVYNLYNSSETLFKRIKKGVKYYKNVRTRIFSDNIVIFYPINSKPVKKLTKDNPALNICLSLSIISLLSAIFQIIAFSGLKWCVRGGISIGSLYNNGTLMWGKGLVKAYQIENTATYPRVIIDRTLIEHLCLSDNKEKLKECLINVDTDGEYYVDFVEVMNLLSEDPYVGTHLHELFEENFAELESDNEKVLEKYRWFAKTYSNSMNKPELLKNYPNLKFNFEEES